ncbi:MAG: ATP-binding protein [Synechococcales cyanobacterium C42_A2020_086]|jgi:predicted AAA+ superfamily ATPase|nr:ATP-binding protein [Synechococcales cyanobacterium C42_A2020_086]
MTSEHCFIEDLQTQAASLLLYQSLFEDEPARAWLKLLTVLSSQTTTAEERLRAYGLWFRAIAATGMSWSAYWRLSVLRAENPFTQAAQQTTWIDLPPALIAAAQHDLRVLQRFDLCSTQPLAQWMRRAVPLDPPLPIWDSKTLSPSVASLSALPIWQTLDAADWGIIVEELAAHYHQFGVGQWATYRAFRWQAGALVGIAHPDPIQLSELVGYEPQKTALIANTEALLAGLPALHVLLYGSRGTGKSSLVKALLGQYGDRGLRLIEVSKAELRDLPLIVDQLRHKPQRFIIFVDDLSFEDDDDAYKALKVVLEGNLTARPQNVVVYATSNRRHLIREFFEDRPRPRDADEIHSWDTVQEKLSFSDRFGLTLTFEPTNQDTYLAIVHHLAQQAALRVDPDDLTFRALQWATRHNGRSGRTARQFVDALRAEAALGTTATGCK